MISFASHLISRKIYQIQSHEIVHEIKKVVLLNFTKFVVKSNEKKVVLLNFMNISLKSNDDLLINYMKFSIESN